MKNLKLLSKIALSFQNLDDFNQQMKNILESLGRIIEVSRVFIFFNETSNTFEWCKSGVKSQAHTIQNIEYEDISFLNDFIKQKGHICSNDIIDLPQEIVNIFEPKEIKSLVVYPLIVNKEIKGFIGLEECEYKREWKSEEIEVLLAVSGIIANAYERKLTQQDVISSESNFRNFFETSNDMLIISDLKGKIIHCNKSLVNKLGYSLLELREKNIIQLHPENKRKKAAIILEKMLRGDIDCCSFEIEGKQKDRHSVETRIWIGKWNKQDCIYSIWVDMTKEHEQALELERIFSVNLDLLCILDMKGNFIKTNKAWNDILGYSQDNLKGSNILDLTHKEDIKITAEVIEKLKDGKKINYFINRYISVAGDEHYLEWRANPYEGLVYAAARDVTERTQYEKKILEISNRDALTNVYNRRYVFSKAEEIIKEFKSNGQIFSVCILDIDFFKKINDNCGHQAGDSVLKGFTKIIGENLRPQDILGRYGGEEFIVILRNSNAWEGNLIMERILNIVRGKTFIFDNNNINFTFSAGISSSDEIDKDILIIYNLVEIADKRMYQAKNTGRNKIVFKKEK